MAAPRQQETGPRFTVKKESGSRFAWVVDTMTGERLKRFDVLKGKDRRNGWNMAEEMAFRLNRDAQIDRLAGY